MIEMMMRFVLLFLNFFILLFNISTFIFILFIFKKGQTLVNYLGRITLLLFVIIICYFGSVAVTSTILRNYQPGPKKFAFVIRLFTTNGFKH